MRTNIQYMASHKLQIYITKIVWEPIYLKILPEKQCIHIIWTFLNIQKTLLWSCPCIFVGDIVCLPSGPDAGGSLWFTVGVSVNTAKAVEHDVSVLLKKMLLPTTRSHLWLGYSEEVSPQPITVAFTCRLGSINMAAFWVLEEGSWCK